MHDLKQINYKTVVQHLVFWTGLILYQAVSYGWENTDQLTFHFAPSVIAVGLPVAMILTYFNLYVLMPKFYYSGKYMGYIVALLFSLLAGGILMRFIAHEFILPWEKVNDPVRYAQEVKYFWIPVRILRLSIEPIPVMAVTMIFQLMKNAFEKEKNLRMLEQANYSAEVSILKSQINPHFFFNTLNTLYGLILSKAAEAGPFALRLGELMHYMIYEVAGEKGLLTDEIKYLENYVSVEQMRFADRLELAFSYTGDITGKLIAPLILLPFVENAFKHGFTENAGRITIHIHVKGDWLQFQVINSHVSDIKRSKGGIGLTNVKRRLELIYPGRYELKITPGNSQYEAELKLNL